MYFHFLILLFFLFPFSFANDPLERAAMLEWPLVSVHLGYPEFWGSPIPVCFWEGITCEDGIHVSRIELTNGFYRDTDLGSIPASISRLTYLKTLLLNDNSFSGTIPTTIGLLTNLQTLGLRNNRFIGTIPEEIFSISSLKTVDLSGNMFNKSKSALLNINQIENCNMVNNNFICPLPSWAGTRCGATCVNKIGIPVVTFYLSNQIVSFPYLLQL